MQCSKSIVWLGCCWPLLYDLFLVKTWPVGSPAPRNSLPLQAAKEKDYWKEMSDASLERIRTTYTWCAHLPLLFQMGSIMEHICLKRTTKHPHYIDQTDRPASPFWADETQSLITSAWLLLFQQIYKWDLQGQAHCHVLPQLQCQDHPGL